MFNKEKWSKIDLLEYRDLKIKEKENDNSIIKGINPEDFDIEVTSSLLEGIPFGIKDNFATKDDITSSASKIIRNFKPNYNSTVFTKLVENGGIPLFKANLDELAMGGTGLTSNFGAVYNPFHEGYISGGSSSGSNYIVADNTVPFSIGSDTGDSVRKPAAYTGIVGFKPTWGIVSRYGMYDFAPTWDTVGWFTKTVKESAILLDVLQGFDPKDNSSLHPTDKEYLAEIEMNDDKYKIVTLPILEKDIVDEEILVDYKKSIEKLKEDGHEIIEAEDIDYKLLSTILTVYKVISSTEAFSCNANLTGFVFGSYFENGKDYEDKITNARTKGFDYEVKKRFLLSQHSRFHEENYYKKAIQLRNLINKEIDRIQGMGDVLLVPTTPNLADDINAFNSFEHTHLLNNILTLFNSNGSPSISIPVTKNGHLSTSVNISALPFNDKKVLKLANRLEEIL